MSESAPALSRFQEAFAGALFAAGGTSLAGSIAALVAQPGFAVYRNTVMKGSIDALQANFPTVERLVGEEWFRAAAARFVAAAPPKQPALIEFGAEFVAFLRGFEPAAEFPYLADVAQLDRLWTEAHIAADADPLDSESIAALTPDQVSTARLQPHPAARWALFQTPALTIWQRNREPLGPEAEFDWLAEAALLTRPQGAVVVTRIDAATCALLDACSAGLPLAAAAQVALDHDPHANLTANLMSLLTAGAFSALAMENSL